MVFHYKTRSTIPLMVLYFQGQDPSGTEPALLMAVEG